MNSLKSWFDCVYKDVFSWWALSLGFCIYAAVSAYGKTGLIITALVGFSQAVILMFVVVPVLSGTMVYLYRKYISKTL